MAELTFVGAAGTVTGSKHLLTVGGKHIFVDCGLFQGTVDVRTLNDAPLPIPAAQVDAVIVTHGHIDHVGYLPKLVHDGFRGAIFATPPTKALMDVVLADSANLQQHLHERGYQHQRPYSPPSYYDQEDVDRTMTLVRTCELNAPFDVLGVLEVTYHNAAHIIGSAFSALAFENKRAIFSGDLGRYGRPILFDPEDIGACDVLVCESTYADRVHPPDSLAELQGALESGMQRGGPIVIPAFAVERSQDLLYSIGSLQRSVPALAQLRVYLDSPMAEKVDAIFENFPTWHRPLSGDGPRTPFGIENLTVIESADESKALRSVQGPYVIISSSGMAAGGRVLHHLHNNVANPKATIVFAGYQSAGTLGYIMTNGAHTVQLLGDSLPVRAAILSMQGFSAHADKNELQRWLQTCTTKPHLYAVHGEPTSAAALTTLAQAGFGWKADVGERGTTVEI